MLPRAARCLPVLLALSLASSSLPAAPAGGDSVAAKSAAGAPAATPAPDPAGVPDLGEARALGRAKRNTEAAAMYRRILELQPDNCIVARELAVLVAATQVGSISESRALYDKTIALGCAETKHYLRAAGLAELVGDGARATELYELAFRHDPKSPDAAKRWGGVLERTARYREAIAVYTQYLRLDPGSAEFRFFIAGTLAREGKCDEMKVFFTSFLNYAFNLPKISREVGKGDTFAKCIAGMEKDLAALDEAERLRKEALDARVAGTDAAKVIALLDKAAKLAPEWVIVLRDAAEALEDAGGLENVEKAIILNEAFARKASHSPEAEEARKANRRLRTLRARLRAEKGLD